MQYYFITMQLPSFESLKKELPLSTTFVEEQRQIVKNIFIKKDNRFVVIVGPCSIHNIDEALLYAEKLKKLSSTLQNLFIIMRFHIEKPRTAFNWKGFLYDPFLDGSEEIILGIKFARKALIKIAHLGLPTAMEILDPFLMPYFNDLISWGLIGSRSTMCQFYRQIAATLPFPIGFKNPPDGNIDAAIYAAMFARNKQKCVLLNDQAQLASSLAKGNPLSHIVLRGSYKEPNFSSATKINFPMLIDCSHGNSQNIPSNQKNVLLASINFQKQNKMIMGVMIESNINSGKQTITKTLLPGISITDSCIGFEETCDMLNVADSLLCQPLCQHQ
jgi:3-deoxy-7-phosphoheptulonate synthase